MRYPGGVQHPGGVPDSGEGEGGGGTRFFVRELGKSASIKAAQTQERQMMSIPHKTGFSAGPSFVESMFEIR